MKLDRDKIIEVGLVEKFAKSKYIKNKLTKIFNYYKEEYQLNTTFEYYNYHRHRNFYNITKDMIGISEEGIHHDLNQLVLLEVNKIDNFLDMAIWCLLHEIKHSIQYHYDREKSETYDGLYTKILYSFNYTFEERAKRYRQIPLEKEADEFANQEINKWR